MKKEGMNMEKKKYENFWETEYSFAMFLNSIFDNYERKYSLSGNGIYNLIIVEGDLYEIKYTQCKVRPKNDNLQLDRVKKSIVDTIVNNLKTNDITISGRKFITFPVANWIAKVEIIKKLKMPT